LTNKYRHNPVLLAEVLHQIKHTTNGTFVDCTLGGAGHAGEILKMIAPDGLLIGIDRDAEAIVAAKEALLDFSQRTIFIQGNFADIDVLLTEAGVGKIDGFLWDLGVSSPQIERAHRGFSYKQTGPLDMRMNASDTLTAYEVVNNYTEQQLSQLFRRYGEERFSSRIAKFIVDHRKRHPLDNTEELVEIIKKAIPASARRTGGHPAKRVFQALRIEVNKELESLRKSLNSSQKWLNTGGKLILISYHSLEDRMIKTMFNDWAKGCICPPRAGICVCGQRPKIKIITKKPILPGKDEVARNPRARSAKMRVAEKI
jgi:16S rRNA (cytosine1402-N4)-methyltransferase